MPIGCIIRSYHRTQYLPQVLKAYSWVDKIVVANFRFRKYGWKGDGEVEEIHEYLC